MRKFMLILAGCASVAPGQSGGIVAGRVVAEGSGQPLQASVMVVAAGAAVQLNSVRADAQGAFTIAAPVGRVQIVAHAEGYASEQVQVMVPPGRGNANVSLSLKAAGSVSGRVVDAAGTAVAGARVWLQYRGEVNFWRSSDEVGGEETDASGFFRLPVVAQGKPFVLHAEADGWLLSSSQTMSLRTPVLPEVLLLLSRRGTTVSGRVLDAGGRPVVNAELQLRAAPAEHVFSTEQRQSIAFARTMNRLTRTQADGAYVFRGVPAGRVVVSAHAQELRGNVDVEAAVDTRVDLTLR